MCYLFAYIGPFDKKPLTAEYILFNHLQNRTAQNLPNGGIKLTALKTEVSRRTGKLAKKQNKQKTQKKCTNIFIFRLRVFMKQVYFFSICSEFEFLRHSGATAIHAGRAGRGTGEKGLA